MRFGFQSPEALAIFRQTTAKNGVNVIAYPRMAYEKCCGRMRSANQLPDPKKSCLACQARGKK